VTSVDPTTTHSYPIDGNYTVQLTVTDNVGATDAASAVLEVSTVVFLRVVSFGSLTLLPNVKVTVYYYDGSAWTAAPAGPSETIIKYDMMTQPDLANTAQEKYRNPGYTASTLCHNASNIGFDIHPSDWTVFFKFEAEAFVAYWPNDASKVLSYDDGTIEAYVYPQGHQPYWDPEVSTYVIRVNDIPKYGVSPTESHPIIVEILCPWPQPKTYLTVRTDPTSVATVPGEGWYTVGTNCTLTAPAYVSVSANTRYRFSYWDVDSASQGAGVNPVTVHLNTNHTATAHYVLQYTVVFTQAGLGSGATGAIVSVNGVAKTYADLPYTLWVDTGGSVAYSYNSPISSSVSGKGYTLTSVSGPASPFTVLGPTTVGGSYAVQYSVTFTQSGLDSTATGTVVTVNGTAKTYGDLPYILWVNPSSTVKYSYSSTVSSTVSGKQFRLTGVQCPPGQFIVTCPTTITGVYCPQYLVTFAQSGLDSTAKGTIVTVNGVSKLFSQLPYTLWVDSGCSITYSYNVTVTSSVSGKQFILLSVTGPSSPITVTGSTTITGNYKTRYYLTVSSPCDSPTPSSGWFDSGSGITESVTSPVSGGSGTQYVCTGWIGTGSVPGSGSASSATFTMGAPSNITWNWKTQYYLTVSSPYGSPSPLSGWFDSNSGITESVTSPVSGGSGTQYVCTGWIGTGSVPGSGSASSATFTMGAPSNITWNWKTQYYLTVSSPYGSPSPLSGWFDSNSGITESVTSPVSGGSGTQYVCTGWAGTGSIPASGSALSVTFTIGAASNITWAWKTQYRVTFDQTGVGSDFVGTVVSVDDAEYSVTGLPVSFWWDSDSGHGFSFASPLVGSKQCVWSSTSGLSGLQGGTLIVTAPGSIVGNYVVQTQITFDQVGVNSDFAGTVIIIDSTNYSKAQLPVSFSWSLGTTHNFTFQSPLIVGASTEQYVWTSTTGSLSSEQSDSITVATYGSIIGNYKTQYYLTVSSPYDSPSPASGWFDSGSGITESVTSPVSGGSGTQYVCTGWSGTGSVPGSGSASSVAFAINTASTITWTWKTRYCLTVSSPYDSPSPASGWFDASSSITASVTSPVSGSTGTRYVCTGWTGTGSVQASGFGLSVTFTIGSASNITWIWKTQYYLTVTSPYGSPSPLSGWFDSGSGITESVTSPVSGGSGTQYVCTGWSGTGSVPASGATSSVTFTIGAASSITWAWKTQYTVTFDNSGLDSSASSTVVTVNGNPVACGLLPYAIWADSGASVKYSYGNVSSSTPGTTFILIGVTGPLSPMTISTSTTVIGNYKTQYHLTFYESGVGSDFTGTVVTVDGTEFNVTQLPTSFWWDNGSSHIFSFSSPLIVSAGKEYDWVSTTGGLTSLQAGTLDVTSSGTVMGSYTVPVKYQVTFNQTEVGADFTGTVMTIDGTGYSQADLPVSFWWISGSSHYFAYQSPLTVASNQKRYVLISVNETSPLTVSGTETVTGNYKTQYYLTLETDPAGVTVPSGSGWHDAGASVQISTDAFVAIAPSSSRYRFNGWSTANASEFADLARSPTTVQMDAGKTVTATYAVQYSVTCAQTGVATEFTGNVTQVDGRNYNVTSLPISFWWDNDSTHYFAFISPLTVSSFKQCVWASTTGLSSLQNGYITVSRAGSLTGNYKIQYLLSVTTNPSGLTPQPTRNPLGVSAGSNQWWYDASTSVSLTAQAVGGELFENWIIDSVSQGSGVVTVTVNMGGPHTATAHYTPSGSLSVTISPPSASIYVGQPLTFASFVTGGTLPYSYQWYDADPQSGTPVLGATHDTWTFVSSSSGKYLVYLVVTDANNKVAQSNVATVFVFPVPVGGYSVSLATHASNWLITAYFALVALFAAAMSLIRRKRK
jgi:hypothetical protein